MQRMLMHNAPGVILPGALCVWVSEGRRVVEVAAAFGLPLPALGAVAVAALAGRARPWPWPT